MRLARIVTVAIALVAALAAPGTAAKPFPDEIPLPGGYFPEGIAIGNGHTAYVGSLVDGAIRRVDLRTGEGIELVPGTPGRIAVGMDYDRSTGNLFVAGGLDGKAYVYDGRSGSEVAVVDLTSLGFVNDVIVTNDAAYFTDSFAPNLYVVPLSPNGAVAGPPSTIALSGDFQFQLGEFNANGIVAHPSGDELIVVNSFFGEIYTVDPTTGIASLIDLGGVAVNGDGLVLAGRTLYAVEGGKNQITKISLAPNWKSGTVVGALTSDAFDVPTTAARFGNRLYAVNAKFGTPPLPSTPYEIVRVRR
jgi:hypothetical protein